MIAPSDVEHWIRTIRAAQYFWWPGQPLRTGERDVRMKNCSRLSEQEREFIRSFPCERCGAESGERCRQTTNGREMPILLHSARQERAQSESELDELELLIALGTAALERGALSTAEVEEITGAQATAKS